MGQCLAQRETELVRIQRAPEHDRHDIGGTDRLPAGLHDFGQARAAMVAQLGDAGVQPWRSFVFGMRRARYNA